MSSTRTARLLRRNKTRTYDAYLQNIARDVRQSKRVKRRRKTKKSRSENDMINTEADDVVDMIIDDDSTWLKLPGEEGFNAYARGRLKVGSFTSCPESDSEKTYSPAQDFVRQLTLTTTPVNRLLVAHQAGSGKSQVMSDILASHFDDPRPKFAIFPNKALEMEFLFNLLRFDGPYRNYLAQELRRPAATFTSGEYIKKNIDKIRSVFRKAGKVRKGVILDDRSSKPFNMQGMLMLCTMTEAGGKTMDKLPWRAYRDSVYVNSPKGYYDDCLVLIDEAHLCTRPELNDKWNATQKKKVAEMTNRLMRSSSVRLIALTATPVQDSPQEDMLKMMRLVYGEPTLSKLEWREGFVSYFMQRPPRLMASFKDNLEYQYVDIKGSNLCEYLNLHVVDKKKVAPEKSQSLEYYVSKKDALKDMGMATKIWQIAADIKASGLRSAVMMSKKHGPDILMKLLQRDGVKVYMGDHVSYNKNLKENSVIILDSKEQSEGISLINVRHMILADISPFMYKHPKDRDRLSWARVQQRIARALRLCSHKTLPEDERNVTATLYVSRLPGYLDDSACCLTDKGKRRQTALCKHLGKHEYTQILTNDEKKLNRLIGELSAYKEVMDMLKTVAIDFDLY